ncbi:hypothetical protein SDC9_128518 [bioreactor metagenome]|uniref:Uncharacterized protein n=1 Tax=bioreactor metagenome TaxID=1076179 RepID=A0A645CX87_9ZZZZ
MGAVIVIVFSATALLSKPLLVAIAFITVVDVIVNGVEYVAEETVGVLPSVV